ncbi:MAG: hypothetical protein KGI84_02970 [Elusimicrobia bacterium]|nr:hypothetical protein [Elusimicrobiota bacterium]
MVLLLIGVSGLLLSSFLIWRTALFNFNISLQSFPVSIHDISNGESLIYAVPEEYRDQMPLDSVSAAVFFSHWGFSMRQWVLAITLAMCALLAAAGLLLESALGPLAAAAALLFFYQSNIDLTTLFSQGGYAFCLLLVCVFLIYRAQRPGAVRTWLLALALGAALLFRSVLFLFPLLLAAREFFSSGRNKKAWLRDSAVLVLVPFLFLIPWIRYGWKVHRDISLFEANQVQSNIIAGTLGMTQGIEGDWSLLLKNPSATIRRPLGIYRWAALEIALHPVRYLRGYGRRLAFVYRVHPWLFLAAFLPLWWRRRRKDVADAALLAAYFLAIYCAMAVQTAYFIPFWPLLCLLAGSSLAAAARALGRFPAAKETRLARRWAQWFSLAVLALVLCACAYCEKIVWAAGTWTGTWKGVETTGPRAEIALASEPDSSWLHFESGQTFLAAGRLTAARDQFESAERLDLSCRMCRLYAAWTEAVSGRSSPLFFLPPPPPSVFRPPPPIPVSQPALSVMRADIYLRRGDRFSAERALNDAFRAYSGGAVLVRDKHVGEGRQALNVLDSLVSFENWSLCVLRGYDAAPMGRLLERTFKKKATWRKKDGCFPLYPE